MQHQDNRNGSEHGDYINCRHFPAIGLIEIIGGISAEQRRWVEFHLLKAVRKQQTGLLKRPLLVRIFLICSYSRILQGIP